MSGLLSEMEMVNFFQLPGCGVAGQEHAVGAWQEDSAGPKLQESGKIC